MSEAIQGSADQTPSGNDQAKKDFVAYETYRRAIGELKASKEKLNSILAEREAEEQKRLKENNEWKTIAEMNERRLKEVEAEKQRQDQLIADSIKRVAFERTLGSKLRDESYYAHVDFDKIVLNPESKQVDPMSVQEVVAEFTKKHSALVENQSGKLPSNAAEGFGGKIPKDTSKMTAQELEEYIISLGKNGQLK